MFQATFLLAPAPISTIKSWMFLITNYLLMVSFKTHVYRTSKLLHPIKTTIKSKKAWHCLLKYKEKVDLTEKLNIPVK